MKRTLFAVLLYIIISAILWIGWQFLSVLTFFPNDIIGTYIEVPVPNKLKLVVINTPFYGKIVNENDETVVHRVDSLQVVGDYVVGRDSSAFFSLNTITQSVSYYDSKDTLKKTEDIDYDSMLCPLGYYESHRKPYDILMMIVIALISLASSLFIKRKRH